MKDNQTFIISYTKKNGEEVTRNAKFIDGKCGQWISKLGEKLFTYFDVDQSNAMGGDQYRMAKNNWRSNNGKNKTRDHQKSFNVGHS